MIALKEVERELLKKVAGMIRTLAKGPAISVVFPLLKAFGGQTKRIFTIEKVFTCMLTLFDIVYPMGKII